MVDLGCLIRHLTCRGQINRQGERRNTLESFRVSSTRPDGNARMERGQDLGRAPVVVKTQVKYGGRGKAGGVNVAKNPDEAEARAKDILGLDIKGHITEKVMVAEGADIAEEYYFSVLLDRSNRTYLAMCSK